MCNASTVLYNKNLEKIKNKTIMHLRYQRIKSSSYTVKHLFKKTMRLVKLLINFKIKGHQNVLK